jgi:hypothetical protein
MEYKFDIKGTHRIRFHIGDEKGIKKWLGNLSYEDCIKYASEEHHIIYGYQYVFPCIEISKERRRIEHISDSQLNKSEEDYQKVRDWYRDKSKDFDSSW